jgi:predicted phosphodiesterase
MRCLVLSDIHSNLEAFQAVLDDAGPVDQIWCLGDVVGYGPDPNACVELLRSKPHLCIAGNHDWATLGKLDLNDFNPDAAAANLWNRNQLTPENLAFLGALPERWVEGSFTMAHGSPCHPVWEYLISPSSAQAAVDCFDTLYCFVGHTHVPIVFRLGSGTRGDRCEPVLPRPNKPMELGAGRMIMNPGGVGQPRDGDPRASYMSLDLPALPAPRPQACGVPCACALGIPLLRGPVPPVPAPYLSVPDGFGQVQADTAKEAILQRHRGAHAQAEGSPGEPVTVEHHRVEYPFEHTQAKMRRHGLPPRLIARLAYGW